MTKRKRSDDVLLEVKCPKLEESTFICPICWESNIPEEKECYLNTCLHKFCVACIRNLPQKSCPMCRAFFSKAYFNIRSEWDFDLLHGGSEDDPSCLICGTMSLKKFTEFREDFLRGPFKSIIKKLEEGTALERCMLEHYLEWSSSIQLFVLASSIKANFDMKIYLKIFNNFGPYFLEELKLKLEDLIRNHGRLGGWKPNFSLHLLVNYLKIKPPWYCEFLEVLRLIFGFTSYHVLTEILIFFQKNLAKMPEYKNHSERMRRQVNRFGIYTRGGILGHLTEDPLVRNIFVGDQLKPLDDYLKHLGADPPI